MVRIVLFYFVYLPTLPYHHPRTIWKHIIGVNYNPFIVIGCPLLGDSAISMDRHPLKIRLPIVPHLSLSHSQPALVCLIVIIKYLVPHSNGGVSDTHVSSALKQQQEPLINHYIVTNCDAAVCFFRFKDYAIYLTGK